MMLKHQNCRVKLDDADFKSDDDVDMNIDEYIVFEDSDQEKW